MDGNENGSSLNSSKLQTIEEQSMEYNNTSHFLHSLHNHLACQDQQSKIYKTINQNEISELLLVNKDEISIEDPQLSIYDQKLFTNTLDLTGGSLTERYSSSRKSVLLPALPKY